MFKLFINLSERKDKIMKQRYALVVVGIAALLTVSNSSNGAVILMNDGKMYNGRVDTNQSLVIKTINGSYKSSLVNVIWLTGDEKKHTRVVGSENLVTGSVEEVKLKFESGGVHSQVNWADVAFYYNGDIPDGVTGLSIIEYEIGGTVGQTVKAQKNAKADRFWVEIKPLNWEGGISLSKPIYESTIDYTTPFTVKLVVRTSKDDYANLQTKAKEIRLVVDFNSVIEKEEDLSVSTSLPVGGMEGLFPSNAESDGTISAEFGGMFSSRYTGAITGNGFVYLYMVPVVMEDGFPSAVKDATFASGAVMVKRTVSNILKLPLKVIDKGGKK
jgi:hypothetical protein